MNKLQKYPSNRMRRYLFLYRLLWVICLPIALLYLFWRSTKDASYRGNLPERFGFYKPKLKDAVWIHAVSMGEMRSAGPLVRELLDRGEKIVLTHFTPAGRKEAQKLFPKEIQKGRVFSVWIPIEFEWAYKKFFKAFSPKYGMVMEIEWWPIMIHACHKHRIPLFATNAQYPAKSYARDTNKNSIRAELPSGFAGIFAKSETQAAKFRNVGATNIAVTGELRFDQPIAPNLLKAAEQFDGFSGRPVVTISSVVVGEDETYIQAIKDSVGRNSNPPVFIYVPRAPERFEESYDLLVSAGLRVARRSTAFDKNLNETAQTQWNETDILLGDSMGEMYFYLALCDVAITGGGFAGKGAHNVIEPLALKKPVIVGPEIQTIEYPAIEAIEAGVLTRVTSSQELAKKIEHLVQSSSSNSPLQEQISKFYDEHSGGCTKTMAALPPLIKRWSEGA